MLGFMSSMKIHEAYQQAKYRFVQNNSLTICKNNQNHNIKFKV